MTEPQSSSSHGNDWTLMLHPLDAVTDMVIRILDGQTIGSSEQADCRLRHSDIAPLHARLTLVDMPDATPPRCRCTVENLAADGDNLLVNDKVVPAGHAIDIPDGAILTLGASRFEVHFANRAVNRATQATRHQRPFSRLISVTSFALHCGNRPSWDDALGHFPPRHTDSHQDSIWVIADGVASEDHGGSASMYAVHAIAWHTLHSDLLNLSGGERLRRAIEHTNTQLLEAAQTYNTEYKTSIRPTTTVVSALLSDGVWWIAHCGDSRAYLHRQGKLTRLTEDHTVANHLIEQGTPPETARNDPNAHKLRQCLGKVARPRIDVAQHKAELGDFLLLCSDGLTRYLSEKQLQDSITAQGMDGWEQLPPQWTQEALRRGGADNISIALILTIPEGHLADRPGPRAMPRVYTGHHDQLTDPGLFFMPPPRRSLFADLSARLRR